MKYLFSQEKRRQCLIINLALLGKIFIVISFLLGIVHLFINDGTDEIRYGLRAYSFVIGNYGHYGLITAVSLAFVIASERSNKRRKIYVILATIDIIMTTKLMAIIVPVVYLLLMYQKKMRKIKKRYFILLAVFVLLVGNQQIQYYIMDLNHPRMRLIIYSIITALDYFPFGSGFATYGSEMAKRYYSALYTKYGFENFYGLSPQNPNCLNDNYIAMILAQFGVFGLLLFINILWLIYKNVFENLKFRTIQERNICAGLLTSMLAASLMSGTYKGAIGMIVFMTIGLLCSEKAEFTEKEMFHGKANHQQDYSLLLVRENP